MGRPTSLRRARRTLVAVLLAFAAAAVAPPARADFDSAKKHFSDNVKAPDWKARRSAYGAFQDHDGGPAAAAILAAATTETHPVVLAAAADTLARFRSDGARKAVLASFAGAKAPSASSRRTLRGVRGRGGRRARRRAAGGAADHRAARGRRAGRLATGAPRRRRRPRRRRACRAVRGRAGLGALGDRGAVGPLVARLAAEKGACGDVIAALEAITRQPLGDAPAAWRLSSRARTPRSSRRSPPTRRRSSGSP
jgi:hypothetical protein